MSISVIVRICIVLPGVPSRLSLERTERESMIIISISVIFIVARISSKWFSVIISISVCDT